MVDGGRWNAERREGSLKDSPKAISISVLYENKRKNESLWQSACNKSQCETPSQIVEANSTNTGLPQGGRF